MIVLRNEIIGSECMMEVSILLGFRGDNHLARIVAGIYLINRDLKTRTHTLALLQFSGSNMRLSSKACYS